MFDGIGVQELLLILLIFLILVGAKKIPKIGSGLGRSVSEFKKRVTEKAHYNKAEKQVIRRRGLQCQVCGHIQRNGAWEKAMDDQVKAMGGSGFINLSAEPQCLNCGSRELRDISHPSSTEKKESKFVCDAAEEIVRIMAPYFKYNKDLGKQEKKRLVAIGKSLYDDGGDTATFTAFKKVRNLAHRRFGYAGTNRLLEVIWDGIGEWRG